jgi:hypothetical protein
MTIWFIHTPRKNSGAKNLYSFCPLAVILSR